MVFQPSVYFNSSCFLFVFILWLVVGLLSFLVSYFMETFLYSETITIILLHLVHYNIE